MELNQHSFRTERIPVHGQIWQNALGDEGEFTELCDSDYPNRVPILRYLLARGLEIRGGPDGVNRTPFHYGAQHCDSHQVELFEFLCSLGLDSLGSGYDTDGLLPIHYAVSFCRVADTGIQLVKKFCESGVSPDVCTLKGDNLLHCLLDSEQSDYIADIKPENIETLVHMGVPINQPNHNGLTPFMVYFRQGRHPSLFHTFIDQGANVHTLYPDTGGNMLSDISHSDPVLCIRTLVSLGLSVHQPDKHGWPSLLFHVEIQTTF